MKGIFRETGLDPKHIDIEVTESVLMENAEEALEILCELKKMGVKLSIDDFGTGYSSLEYLKMMAVDTLKIARPFVRDITTDSDDESICRAIVSLAHNLKIDVLAEGVETQEQLRLVESLGCDKAQGYSSSSLWISLRPRTY